MLIRRLRALRLRWSIGWLRIRRLRLSVRSCLVLLNVCVSAVLRFVLYFICVHVISLWAVLDRTSARAASDKLRENDVRAYFNYPVPRNEYVVGRRYALKKTLFARHDKAEYAAAVVEQHIANVSKLSAVGYVYDGLS